MNKIKETIIKTFKDIAEALYFSVMFAIGVALAYFTLKFFGHEFAEKDITYYCGMISGVFIGVLIKK